ncbi:hypothetical protein [Teredinibacter haidensis]|uniref:hypothetical protein n=1 Tax=Teredinibacter haidensis TaxID=2731755 RepID=UPI0009489E2E|nr:hypothetical protein [Teredinibacter haidensis]
MFKFLAKSFVATVLWGRYKRLVLSTILLFVAYFIVSMVHDDYLEYSLAVGAAQSLSWAYLAKWVGIALLSIAYYLFNFPPSVFTREKKQSSEPDGTKDNTLGSIESTEVGDPFNHIRKKKVLKGRGEAGLKGGD